MGKMLVQSPPGARQMQSPERLCCAVLASSARGARPTLAGPGVNGCEPVPSLFVRAYNPRSSRASLARGGHGRRWDTREDGEPERHGWRPHELSTVLRQPPKRRNQV